MKKTRGDYEGNYRIGKRPMKMKDHNQKSWDKLALDSPKGIVEAME